MILHRIKDNSKQKKTDFVNIGNLTAEVADKTLQQLEYEGVFVFPEVLNKAEDISDDEMILSSINDEYQSGNVMGFIGQGDERLAIESRFSSGDEDYFFRYLLCRVLDIPNIVNLKVGADIDNSMFSLLHFLFPHYLRTAMRKGLFKQYVRREYNDMNPKGSIDVAQHIKLNTPFTGNIAYVQREFSYDNSLMELVRHTIEFIKAKPYGKNILANIKDEVSLVISATSGYRPFDRQKVIDENRKNLIHHAYYREYLALQRLCLLILRYQKHQINSGSRQIYGILFDGAWLWEEYINLLIGDMFYHPMNKKGDGRQYLFKSESGNVGLIYPDFISKSDAPRIIADAKYKPIDNIAGRDYLQVLAYMCRFEAGTGYYLYPETGNATKTRLWLNRGVSFNGKVEAREDISVIKLGLKIPHDAAEYAAFAVDMEKNENEFTKLICG